jgi:hypothetical protein
MKRSSIPPLGVRPRFVVDEDRIREIEAGIGRFLEAKWPIPIEVVNEYNELVDKLGTENKTRVDFASMKKFCDGV